MTENEQAAIAFDHLISFIVKVDIYKHSRERLLDLILEHWQDRVDCPLGPARECTFLDAARQFVFDAARYDPAQNVEHARES